MATPELPGRRIGPDPEDRVPDAPCYLHEEPNPWCPVCRGTRSTMAVLRDRRIHRELTGIEKYDLDRVRERLVGNPLDSIPVLDFDQVVAWAESVCRGDVE